MFFHEWRQFSTNCEIKIYSFATFERNFVTLPYLFQISCLPFLLQLNKERDRLQAMMHHLHMKPHNQEQHKQDNVSHFKRD
jgi:uncharacterized membrane protein YkgB